MSIKSYNAFFTEPPSNSNNKIGVSNSEHPALISLFKPETDIVTSIFILLKNESLSNSRTISNSLKLSIIELDELNSYLPADHEAAVAEAIKNQNNYGTYVSTLHDGSLSGVITKTNINFKGTETWVEFKFTAGFITNSSNELNPDKYYGILISDTSESNISNKIFYADKSYGQTSLNRTLYLTVDDGDLTWQNYQLGDNNIQICVAYASGELTASSLLNAGTISTGGPNSNRGTGLGIFVRNTSSSSTFKVNNFSLSPESGSTDIGLENFTYNSNFKWMYYNKNTLPSTTLELDSGKIASSNLRQNLEPDDFLFFYQKDWVSPLPVPFLSKVSRQFLHVDNLIDNNGYDEIRSFFDSGTVYSLIENPVNRFEYEKVKLFSENTDQVLGDSTLAQVFSTDYPGHSIVNEDLQDIRIDQIIRDSDDNLTYNVFECSPFGSTKFFDSNSGLDLSDTFFENKTYYMNSSVERTDWQSNNSLGSYENGSSGMLTSYGVEIDSDNSNGSKIVFKNKKIFPSTTLGTPVTDVRGVALSYHSDDAGDKFKLTRNNTINIEGMNISDVNENSLKYRLVFHNEHEDDGFQWPPHLIIRNYSAGTNNSQNLVLGGLDFYTSSYSVFQGDLNLSVSEASSGTIHPSRTSIVDSNLGTYEIPVAKSAVSDATSVYGKGLTLTIHQDSDLDADTATNGFIDKKYLIRHIVDNIITIEGKVLAYGLCRAHRVGNTVTTTLLNVSSSDFDGDGWDNLQSSNYKLSLNPFGLLFDEFVDGDQSVGSIYNNGDPIELVSIDGFNQSLGRITSNNVDDAFWWKLFPRNVDGVDYYPPDRMISIPFYIIEIPKLTAFSAGDEPAGIAGSPYGAVDSKWIGQFPDFFEIGNQIYSAGPYIAGGTSPLTRYVGSLGVANINDALLPYPDGDASVGYSITFPYIEHLNDLSGLPWLSLLFSGLVDTTDLTNIDLTESDNIDIYDNPSEKFRAQKKADGTYHQYHIVDPFTSGNNPENICRSYYKSSFENIGDSSQIHISEYGSNNNYYKYVSFIYSVSGDSSSSVSSNCELQLQSHKDNFIYTKQNSSNNIISSIVLGSTTSGISNTISGTLDSIYSYEFDNPIAFNDLIIKRVGGDASAYVNNLVLFNDIAVYGKCTNPVNIWRNDAGTNNNFCEIPSNGYVVIDLGYPRKVIDLEFTVSKISTGIETFNDGDISFSILGVDPNLSNSFLEIDVQSNVNSSKLISTPQSFLNFNIGRTLKYIVIKPLSNSFSTYLQNLVINIDDIDLNYYIGSSTTKYSFLPSESGSISTLITQPRNRHFSIYPYNDSFRFATINPGDGSTYNALYVPVGTTDAVPTGAEVAPQVWKGGIWNSTTPTSISDIITTPTSVTQISFNIKQHGKSSFSSNNSFLFKLYTSSGIDPSSDLTNDGTDFTERYSILALPYSREPEEDFYTILSTKEDIIYIDTTDIIFSNDNMVGYLVRLDLFRDLYSVVEESGILSNGQSFIRINGSTSGMGLLSGGKIFFERSNVLSFPAINATWLKLEYVNTTVQIDIFGFKAYTSIIDNNNSPVDVTTASFSTMNWNMQINYSQD